MIVESPDEQRWRELVRDYGTPRFADRVWNMPERIENVEPPTISGEVILLIFNLAGSCVFVRRRGVLDWFFPMGRIGMKEGIIDAARREAMEEAGVEIHPVGVPLCQRVTLHFKNLTFQRWHLIVVAETISSVLTPTDGEIEEARFFDLPPSLVDLEVMSWMNELHREGMKYLRSMDAMDGI